MPLSGLAALQALRDVGQVQPGQQVLVLGAAGGVGSFAVQLATAFGAQVTGVASTTQLDLIRSLGADQVIDYTGQDVTDGTRHWTASSTPAATVPGPGFDRNLRAVLLSRLVASTCAC